MSNKRDLIIAEDNPRDREFLIEALADEFDLSIAVNGKEAMAMAIALEQSEPLVISDLQMPEMNGVELARQLWRLKPESRIVFWSQHQDEMYVRALVKIIPPETVYGYVLKDNSAQTLIKAIQAVFLDSQCWVDSKVRPVQARAQHRNSAVTDFEYEVLIDIALGLTDNLIAQRRYLSRRGVQNRLQSLYSKLGVEQEKLVDNLSGEGINMRARAVAIALHRGLINAFELKQDEQKFQVWMENQ